MTKYPRNEVPNSPFFPDMFVVAIVLLCYMRPAYPVRGMDVHAVFFFFFFKEEKSKSILGPMVVDSTGYPVKHVFYVVTAHAVSHGVGD